MADDENSLEGVVYNHQRSAEMRKSYKRTPLDDLTKRQRDEFNQMTERQVAASKKLEREHRTAVAKRGDTPRDFERRQFVERGHLDAEHVKERRTLSEKHAEERQALAKGSAPGKK